MAGTTYYAIALVVTIAVALTLAGVAWRRRSIPGGTYFALMMLSGAWWAFSYAMEALSKEQSQKIIWVQLSNLGDGTMPVFFMLFALSYWRPDIRIQLKYQIMIWLIPVATIIIAATNGLHGFLWSEITPSVENPNILIFEHGPWFYVTMTYYYLTMWIGVVFLFRAATSLSRIYRRQALIVLVAAVIPWIANALFLFGFSPVHGLDIAPIMASATGLLLAFGIVKFQLFKVLPIAKEIVYKQIENGVLIVSSGGIIVDINPAAKNMLGADVEVGQNLEAVLKNRLAISFPLPAVHQRTEASLNDREKPLWLDVVIAPLYDRRKQLSGHLIMLNDISERKRAEEVQHRLAVIVESSHDAILSKTLDGIITTWNSGAEMLYGYTTEEAIGHSVSMLIPPESADEGRQFLEKVRRGEAVKDYEAVRITKDKRRINVLLTISPIHDMSGRIIAASTIAQDITKLRRAAEVLKESEKKYRDLFENANEAIFVAQNEKLVFINPMLTKMFGYSAAELSAKPFIAFIHSDDQGMVIDRHRRRLMGEDLPSTYSFRIIRRDGNIRWVDLSTVVIDWEGKPATLNFLSDITEHREAEEALKKSEERYRLLAENATDVIWIANMDMQLTYISPSVRRLLGYTAEEAMARPMVEVYTPASVTATIEVLKEEMALEQTGLADPKRSRMLEVELYRKDGSIVPVETNFSIIHDVAGKNVGTLAIARDITARRRVEEALRESERKYRSLTEKMNDIVWIMGLDLRTTYVSPSVFKGLGFTPEEYMKRQIQDQLTPESLRDVTQTWTAELERDGMEGVDPNRIVALEVEYYRKNGSTVWMENVVSAIRDDQGKAVGLHGVSRDITERKRAEEALRQSEQKFKDLAEQLPQTIFEIDMEGHFTYANRYGLEFHGYTWDESTKGINAIDFFVPEQRQRVIDNMAKILRGEEYDEHEYSVLKKDGSTYPALIYSNAIMQDGRPVGIRGVIVDITERKKVEQMKNDFVSFISHQLRTPVAGLMGYIDNMLEGITGELNDRQAEYLNEMRDVCVRNNRLIADLLNISRLERGVVSVNIQPTYLRDKVEMAVRDYKKSIEDKGLALRINEVEPGISVLADSDKLVEVLKNVIHNAFKFTRQGSIDIEISSRGNEGIVNIKDSGVGMTEAVMKDLFKKEKVFGGAIAVGGGAGLGLYIAKGFMKLQGGDIIVESVVGKGSTFIISIPRK